MKVAIIEPGYFKTGIVRADKLLASAKVLWDQASSEVKELYGESFLASCK